MTVIHMTRRLCQAALVALLAIVSSATMAASASAHANSMDALGDSITRAFNTCSFPFTDCPENSWATGTNSAVDSYYLRALAVNSGIIGHNFNDAVSGAKMEALKGQAEKAVSRKAELVGILMGANDACTSSLATMTSVATYKSEFEEGMNTLTTGLPDVTVNVGSLPNVYRLWEIFHTNSTAVNTWNSLKICQSLLEKPTSLEKADEERRLKVRAREEEYDTVLETVCAKYTQCKFDKDAGFKTVFNTNDVSTRDFFHPSIEGQALIAKEAWESFPY